MSDYTAMQLNITENSTMNAGDDVDQMPLSGNYCDGFWDTLMYWPTTQVNTTVSRPCPKLKGSDTSRTISKYCAPSGMWKSTSDEEDTETNSHWTNYSACFTEEILKLMQQLSRIPTEEIQFKLNFAKIIRMLELIGLGSSLLAISASFAIYYYFRSLRNDRTRIHAHLFAAVFGTALMKLIIFIDQLIIGYGKIDVDKTGFDNTPILCETAYVMLEYSKSATSSWMFLEALHLFRAVAITATQMTFQKSYLLFGWGFPIIFVVIWVGAMLSKPRSHCWFGYNYNPLFKILEVPRIIVLVINTYYLVRIVIIVFIKLKRDISTEIDRLRRTAKSTLALIPLLGITNYIMYAEPTLDGSITYFIFYSLISYFLSSFQGMFISLMYCLLNNEVKEAVWSKFTCSFKNPFRRTEQLQSSKTAKPNRSLESAI